MELKKEIKFFNYSSFFLQNKTFFFCLLDNHTNYFNLSQQLRLNNFKIKFIKNGFTRNLIQFGNIKHYLKGQLYCIAKTGNLEINDYLILKDFLFRKSSVIIFSLDNQFYSKTKFKFLLNFLKSRSIQLPYLSYFYFLLKLGFILKLEKFNISHLDNRVLMT